MYKSIFSLPFLALSIAVAAEPAANQPDIFGAIFANDMKMIQKFAEEDPACLTRPTKSGFLPIHYAALRDNFEALRKLEKAGAQIDATTTGSKKMSALHVAALQNAEDSVRWLIDRKADVNARDAKGATPLHYAAKCKGDASRVIRRLVKAGALLAAVDADGNTPLHVAAIYGTKGTIKALLDAKADPAIRNNEGAAPADLVLDEAIKGLIPTPPKSSAESVAPSVTVLSEKPAPAPAAQAPSAPPAPVSAPTTAQVPAIPAAESPTAPTPIPEEVATTAPPEESELAAQHAAQAAAMLDDESIPHADRFTRFLEIPGSQPMPDGTFFNGAIRNGHFEGYGVLLVRDNGRERYVGWFRHGRKSGHGIYRYANGDRLEAEWKDDAPNGAGTFTFANGCVITGSWKNGIFWEGSGQFRLGKDQLHYGAWADGELLRSERITQ